MKLYWDTPEDIAEQLFEAQPETDPLSIRFTRPAPLGNGPGGFQ